MYTGICSGNDKAVMPWSAIIQSQDDFVARKYLPVDVDLKKPSKLQNQDTTALLNFWYVLRSYSKDIGSEGLRPQLVCHAPFPSIAPYFRILYLSYPKIQMAIVAYPKVWTTIIWYLDVETSIVFLSKNKE
jgi:hypothetical protein